MIEVRKKEGESPNTLLYRFSKKIQQSGVLKEAKKRKYKGRPITKRRRKNSALAREQKRKEIERAKKLGMV